jgi:hypothetical protein
MRFAIWCEVSGPSGDRQDWLKAKGRVVLYPTRREADRECARLNESHRKNIRVHAVIADFHYSVRKRPED